MGEAVDDHQVTFGRWMHERGQAVCVEDEDALRAHLDAAQVDPARYAVDATEAGPSPAVTLFGDLVDGMLAR